MKTREQIEAMTGAEVDAYLAEKVMGWVSRRNLADNHFAGWIDREKWNPSTCLDDAMQAAEKVGCGGFMLWRYEGSTDWGCESDSRFPMRAPTPALAICRAVIAANEAKEART
jgi:hypothetical protein